MVLDIEKYPSFVPWCINSEVYERKNFEDRVEIKADMTVGKKILNQTYLSNVIYFKKKNYILVTNIKGPLKYLKNETLPKLDDKGLSLFLQSKVKASH